MPPLRVLMVTKYREFRGGVERHVDDLVRELRARGCVVEFFTSEQVSEAGGSVFNAAAERGKSHLKTAQELLWNRDARVYFQRAIDDFKPDIVHYHSIYHQLSPSLLGAFDGAQVMTLHDYKLAAPCYSLFRDGDVCTECVGKQFPTAAIRHRCVSNSKAASFLCSVESLLHRQRYERAVDMFILPSEFLRGIMVQAGVDPALLTVIPWGVPAIPAPTSAPAPAPASKKNGAMVVTYIGRLHQTKGIGVLLEAWASKSKALNLTLVIAGAGAMENEVQIAASLDPSIQFLGLIAPCDVPGLMRKSDVTVVPSLSPETMGLSAIESLMQGTPLISSGRGALGDLKGNGVAELADMHPATLAELLRRLFGSQMEIKQLRADLIERDLSIYAGDRMVSSIVDQYRLAINKYRQLDQALI